MMTTCRSILLLAALLIFTQTICFSNELTSEERSDFAIELFQMSQSLDHLTQQLKAQQALDDENQKLQSAISYLSFRSRSIEMMQYDLRFKKERLSVIEKNIERIAEELDDYEDNGTTININNNAEITNGNRKKEDQLKIFRESHETLSSDIMRLENEIQVQKDELSSFEVYVQERLSLIK